MATTARWPAGLMLVLSFGLAPWVAPAAARADGGEPQDRTDAGTSSPERPPPDRPVPDYDGRPEPPPTAGEMLLWVPRVLMAPLYAVSEYVVRKPLGWAVSNAEEQEIPAKVLQFFTFGKEQRGAWAPTFLFDFGFRPSVGLYFKLDDAGVENHDFRFHFGTWGPEWISVGVANRFDPEAKPWDIQLATTATRRPDGLFYGIGDSIEDRLRSRYQFDRITAELRLTADDLWLQSGVQVWNGIRYMDFGNDVCCGDPSIGERVDQGVFESPPGFPEGYLVYEQGIQLVVDTRRERPHPGTGARLRLNGSHMLDVRDPLGLRWVEYGVQVGAYLDLTGRNNVLGVTTTVELVEPIDGEVPFTELVSLSGNGPLRGFVGQRLVGESGAALVAEYRWPIWMWLDASVHVGVGNVFDGRFDGFALDRLRMSWGIGVRTNERDHSFDLLIAFGTEPLEDGAEVESFRFVFGGTRGF